MKSVPKRSRARLDREALLRTIPTWDDVRFFLAIHRAGSLSAAAGPLQVTQPTCGRRLAALEASLGLRLFDRTPEGLALTEHGATLLDAAIAMEQGAHDLALRAAVRDRGLDGTVRIGTNELFASTSLVAALTRLRETWPGVRIELALSNDEADLLRREADLAIRFRPTGQRLTPANLVAIKLGDAPFLLYGSEAYLARRGTPSDPEALDGHDVVSFTGRYAATPWCAKAFASANVVLSAASMQVTATAIAGGLGLGVLPRRAARAFPQLLPLSPPVAHGTGWIVVHPDLRRVPRVRVVIDTLVAFYRSDPL